MKTYKLIFLFLFCISFQPDFPVPVSSNNHLLTVDHINNCASAKYLVHHYGVVKFCLSVHLIGAGSIPTLSQGEKHSLREN